MGCTTSKLDDLPAVALCRERCAFLNQAINRRYLLAEAHIAYIHSLKGVGHSLQNFIHEDFAILSGSPPSSPELALPPEKKQQTAAVDVAAAPSSSHPRHSHSSSGSHLQFHSDSDEEEDPDDELGSLHNSGHSSPLHSHDDHPHMGYMDNSDPAGPVSFPGRFMHMNYMKKSSTPSVVYQQRPMSSETLYMGESSSSYYPYPPYPNMNPNLASSQPQAYPYYGYQNYGAQDYYGSPPQYPYAGPSSPRRQFAAASSSKPSPPPPPPPKTSAWDFLNPFDSYEGEYYSQNTPSRDSKELREEEGIPDLEDESYQHEVVKEVHGDQKLVDDATAHFSKPVMNEEMDSREEGSLYQTRPSVSMEDGGLEYEVHVMGKKVVENQERPQERGGGDGLKARRGSRDALELSKEIQLQFDRASESGIEVAKMLEVGKLPYQRKHGLYQASSKMLHVVSPSLHLESSQLSTSRDPEALAVPDKDGRAQLDIESDVVQSPSNLSCTLQKLYLWEKKLYEEVKNEEKMRVIHDRKCLKLKKLDERGAEAHKIESTQTLIRSLSTKIRIAIQVIDKTSVTINHIRDDELWPQLDELIQGLTRMWKSMLECHRNQCEAIREARNLGSIGSRRKFSEAHLEATKQLERELVNWTFRFSTWVSAQKGYVTALNNWLLKCLLDEPEETEDGRVPFSPGRMGAPTVFVICNQWSQALERISEQEVIESMRAFTASLLQIWDQDKLELQQRMMGNKDLERKVRNLDREEHKIQKEIQALEKKMIQVSGKGNSLSVACNMLYPVDKNTSLQTTLQRIFDAMERFTDESARVYEDLLQCCVDERVHRAS